MPLILLCTLAAQMLSAANAAESASTAAVSGAALERRMGQMLMVGAPLSGEARQLDHLICDLQAGALLLFDHQPQAQRKAFSPQRIARLAAAVKRIGARCGNDSVLIAVDAEGGSVNRFRPGRGFPRTRSHAQLGKRGNPALTEVEASLLGRALKRAGVHWNLAPVVDVDINPQNPIIGRLGRSFSADPNKVADHAAAFVSGLRKHGVLSTLKHFPGHGSSTSDSHKEWVDVTRTADLEKELLPFHELISSGKADAIMTAHVFNAALDPQWPASLSSAAIRGILREQLGFKGLVLSEDLQMAAVSGRYPLEQAAVQAIDAGSDMILLSGPVTADGKYVGRAVRDSLVKAFQEGRLSDGRIANSLRRINALKAVVNLRRAEQEISREFSPASLKGGSSLR